MTKNWVELMKKSPDLTTKQIYQEYRIPFVKWIMGTYRYSEADAEDFFQETIIIFYQKIMAGNLSELTYGLKTYLYAIAKLLVLKHRSKAKLVLVDELGLELSLNLLYGQSAQKNEPSSKAEKVAELMRNLNEPCKSILHLFYFKRFKLSQIAEQLNYKNENVVKVQKKRCLGYFMKMTKKSNKLKQ